REANGSAVREKARQLSNGEARGRDVSELLDGVPAAVRSVLAPLLGGEPRAAAPAPGKPAAGSLNEVPALSAELSSAALDVDADLLVAHDAAVRADRAGNEAPDAAAAAWKALASRKGANPWRAEAEKRAKQWKQPAAQKTALASRRAADEAKLKKVLP